MCKHNGNVYDPCCTGSQQLRLEHNRKCYGKWHRYYSYGNLWSRLDRWYIVCIISNKLLHLTGKMYSYQQYSIHTGCNKRKLYGMS